jgi:anti-anti-sigma factor
VSTRKARLAGRTIVEMTSVALSGELDLATAPELETRLESLDGDNLIDCRGLTFIDASGLRPLLSAHRRCSRRDTRLILVNAPLCLTRLLMLTGLEPMFHVQTASCAVHTAARAGVCRSMSPVANHAPKGEGGSS